MQPIARSADLVVEHLGHEIVVFDSLTSQAHTLNRTAAVVFRNADGRTPLATIAERVAEELGTAPDAAVVEMALDQLGRAGLLEEAPAVKGMSRREAMRRLGVAGAAAAILPLVRTIAAPTPAMAASGPATCGVGSLGSPCSTSADCCPPLRCLPDDPFNPTSPSSCQLDF